MLQAHRTFPMPPKRKVPVDTLATTSVFIVEMKRHLESNPATVAAPDGHFSQGTVVRAGASMLYVSGQVARDPDGRTVGQGSMTIQAEQVFSNIHAILASHEASFDNVVKVTLFITKMELAPQVVEVRKRFYGPNKPASTFVGVTALNDPEWWLEVEVIAELPGRGAE